MSYLTNPYMVTPAVEPLDDTDLKCYWKFDEASGNIINQSVSSESLGSSADLVMTGGTYETGSPPVNSGSVLFDGVDDYGQVSSLSMWNFMHDSSCLYTVAWWMKTVAINGGCHIFSTTYTEGTTIGHMFRYELPNDHLFLISTRGVDYTRLYVKKTTANYIPNFTSWNFYVATADISATPMFKISRNNANVETSNKEGVANNNNSTYNGTVSRRPDSSAGFGNQYLSEMSIWNRVLTADEITNLYNGGAGRAIY
jgi:hypothetical protein